MAQDTRHPSENDSVHPVRGAHKEHDTEIPHPGVKCADADGEPSYGAQFGDGSVPRPLVHAAAVPAEKYGDEAREDIRRAGKNKRLGGIQSEFLDEGGHEILEAVGGEVEAVQETKEPSAVVGTGLAQSGPNTCTCFASLGHVLGYAPTFRKCVSCKRRHSNEEHILGLLASSLSSGVSHHVVLGVLGRMKKEIRATNMEMAPWIIKTLFAGG